ncbi:MAG: hypothetical protein GY824_22730, partial [Delftia sp.]|nr:hypothetical protein [Delftia sp.]
MTNNDPNTPQEWRPPPDFIPVTSALPGVRVYAPAPDEPEPERQQFKCPRCGASTAYSAGEAALACAHCGHVEAPDAPVVGREAPQAEFTVETMEQEARGWGQVRREIHCQSCGADIVLEPGDLTAACPFCASQRVLTRQEARQAIRRPTHLIPFQVDQRAAARQLQDWLAEGWMHPPQLRQAAASARLNGVYLPFWIFRARLRNSWKAEVG